jgi:hypothetical protein
MSHEFEAKEPTSFARGPARDPWLHFTITAEDRSDEEDLEDASPLPRPPWLPTPSDAARASSVSASWSNDPGETHDPASVLVTHALRLGDTISVLGGATPPGAVANSIACLVSGKQFGGPTDAAASGADRTVRLPEVGDTLFGFHLRYPLGRGAFARVFLAEQSDLAGRPVVLKVSAIEGTEPQMLAQLQHTNIVPIYSSHEDPHAGLRAVCMPYFGGASLWDVIQHAWGGVSIPLRGADLVAALETVASPRPGGLKDGVKTDPRAAPPADDPSANPPDRMPDDQECDNVCKMLAHLRKWSYIQATAWIVAQVAEGLHHAHQRGVLHRDIKPSNILISAEGQPLLLDFNLAQDRDIDPALATLGGTVAYMAPEHLRALASRSVALTRLVDARSDIYSLGMVLAEMLLGQSPFDQSASYSALPLQIEALAADRSRLNPSVRQQRPDIPWGLESIVRKCLAPDAALRYQQADHLA